MKAEIVEGWPKENSIRIALSETDASQVNAIRRALISDVPKLAITRVNISQGVEEKDDGQILESVNVLPDEMLAHRLAMIPVPTYPEEKLDYFETCPVCIEMVEAEKGCPQCQVLYSLNAQGPAPDVEEDYITVYAGDLKTISDPMYDIKEEHRRIPITILSKGQYLELYAFATLGRGSSHQKWSPVAGVGFSGRNIVKLNNAKKAETLFSLNLKTTDGRDINAKLFGKDKTVEDVNTVIDLEKALHQVGPGTGREADFDGAISIEPVDGSYVLSYETDGSLDPVTAFNQAMNELSNRFTGLNEEITSALK
ncbi:MAG TPA: DNA-directed RNA polymerase subunit D [Candidatus Poseidoniaceae archaeon]|nr:DNA-directed RNA polymerase subunit D [Candidatus Poseidoniaceae archaeon]HII50453.1 DNA-directed RNA polymerase subunit D [Candidatus Poseidoniaceae archaeon]